MKMGYYSTYFCLRFHLSVVILEFSEEIFDLFKFIPKYFIAFDAAVNAISLFPFQETHCLCIEMVLILLCADFISCNFH